MLKLENHLTLDEAAINAPNLCDRFSENDLTAIGNWVFAGYSTDKQSRQKWEKRSEAANDLAMQYTKDKNFPWPNCSNIAFPLVTIGAMQFHARAYPTIIQGTDIVKMRVVGPDPNGEEHARAKRVSSHMSYQVLEEDQSWEEQHDRGLLAMSIVGCVFVKTYFSPREGHNVSEMVLPRDFVLNYWAKSVNECPRKTHCFPLSRNEIREKALSDVYRDVLDEAWYASPPVPPTTTQQQRADTRTGVAPPSTVDETTPFRGLEQHCLLDLDGDGYAEPYIITIEETSKSVLRIVSRIARIEDIDRVEAPGPHKGQIIRARAEEYFTKYSFIPSPDGGIYDIGFGVLLGPLNESVNSIINQLVDAGTMSNTAGGFLGRGAKIRGGVYTFTPFGWNRVDSTGDDLRKSIFPLPVREPNAVLFQLLGLLVNYTNRISGATDTIVGENPGQNTPAQTTQTMVEMGMKIYNAIFKRVWRGMKEEFKKLYVLNGLYMPVVGKKYGPNNDEVSRDDYLGDPNKVVPEADPNITSESQRIQLALSIREMSRTSPGGYNLEEVERRTLKAMNVDDLDTIYPGMGSDKATPPGKDPKLAIQEMKQEIDRAELELRKTELFAKLLEEKRVNDAIILELEAKATLEMEKAGGEKMGKEIALFDAHLGALKQRNEHLSKQLETMMSHWSDHKQREHELELADKQRAVERVAS